MYYLKKKVIKFAKKTGDLATLSKTDLKVIALTWMLEKEAGNLESIRTEPVKVIFIFIYIYKWIK